MCGISYVIDSPCGCFYKLFCQTSHPLSFGPVKCLYKDLGTVRLASVDSQVPSCLLPATTVRTQEAPHHTIYGVLPFNLLG